MITVFKNYYSMNPKITLILSLLVGGAVHFGATAATLIVDNDISHVAPEGSTIYRTAQSAHDAATAGDTIIFMGSAISYGPLILSKPLKLIGPGYDLALNYPEKNTGLRSAAIERLSFDYTANTSSSGSDIQGVVINGRIEMQIAGLGGYTMYPSLHARLQLDFT